MAETISRRRILASLTVAGVAVAGGLATLLNDHPPQAAPPNKTVTVYIARKETASQYNIESFKLAQEFLRKEAGLDINFVYTTEKKAKAQDLDHITKFAIIEKNGSALAEMHRKIYEKDIVRRAKLADEQAKALRAKGDIIGAEYVEDVASTVLGTEMLILPGKTLEDMMKNNGKAHVQEGIGYITTSINRYQNDGFAEYFNLLLDLESALDKEGKSIAPPPKERKKLKEKLAKKLEIRKRSNAKTIVHELLHLIGFWHTHDFSNDPHNDYDGKVPNVMSYKGPSLGGTYGFGLNNAQKQYIKSYFARGEPFKRLKSHGFVHSRNKAAIQKENRWIAIKSDK